MVFEKKKKIFLYRQAMNTMKCSVANLVAFSLIFDVFVFPFSCDAFLLL